MARKKTYRKNAAPTDADVNAALSVLRADYYSDVLSVAEDLAQQMQEGDIEDEEELRERMSDAIDSTQRVIYTMQAKIGLICSDNADAYYDAMGELPIEDGQLKWEAMMFMAMERDVEERLSASIDINDPSSWPDIDLRDFNP
jgi:hypothetical protein